MPTNCGGITVGSSFDCIDRLKAGVDQTVQIGNLADINTITIAAGIVSALTMKVGKAMFAFDGFRDSLQPRSLIVPGAVTLGYDHQLDFTTFTIGSVDRLNLEQMALQKQFALVQNGDDTSLGNAFFECFGLFRGLEIFTNERINADGETGAGYVIQLKTPDTGSKEDTLPPVFFDTDFTTTLAAYTALLTPAV